MSLVLFSVSFLISFFSYKITVNIETTDKVDTKSLSSEVTIEDNIIQSFEYGYIPKLFMNEHEKFHFNLLAQNLLPNCLAKWDVSSAEIKDLSALSKVSRKIREIQLTPTFSASPRDSDKRPRGTLLIRNF